MRHTQKQIKTANQINGAKKLANNERNKQMGKLMDSLLLHLVGLHSGPVSQWAARKAAVGGVIASHVTRTIATRGGTSGLRFLP